MATNYTHKNNHFLFNLNPDLTQSLLVSAFGETYAKSLYFSEDPEEEIKEALNFIIKTSSEILILDTHTGEILHQIPISGNLTEKQEELLRGFSCENMVGGVH